MAKKTNEEQFLNAVGARLRQIRLEKGWTLEETEEYGWPNWRHLQKIESGKNFTLASLYRISRLYKLPVSEILKEL